MDVEKLITHLRYSTPYSGDVQRDTLDALERLSEAEAVEYEMTAVINSTIAELETLTDGDDVRAAIDDIIEQLRGAL